MMLWIAIIILAVVGVIVLTWASYRAGRGDAINRIQCCYCGETAHHKELKQEPPVYACGNCSLTFFIHAKPRVIPAKETEDDEPAT